MERLRRVSKTSRVRRVNFDQWRDQWAGSADFVNEPRTGEKSNAATSSLDEVPVASRMGEKLVDSAGWTKPTFDRAG